MNKSSLRIENEHKKQNIYRKRNRLSVNYVRNKNRNDWIMQFREEILKHIFWHKNRSCWVLI